MRALRTPLCVPLLSLVLSADVAWAAGGTTGGGCCSAVWLAIMLAIYRSGGVEWPMAVGTALLPGVFGWFVFRDHAVSTGVRVVALVSAILQVVGLVATLVLFAFAASFLNQQLSSLGLREALDTRQQFIGHCSAESPPAVCSCIADAAEDRSVEDRKQLATGEPGPLAQWLATERATCAKKLELPEFGGVDVGAEPESKVSSVPSGATVWLDGKEVGKTPLALKLTAGRNNEVRATLDGYFPQTLVRSPNANQHLQLEFFLLPAAHLEVTSEPPGAEVFLNGTRVLAATPGTTDALEPGDLEVLVRLAGYQPQLEAVTVKQGAAPLHVVLKPGVNLAVSANPEVNAEVWLDGHWVGTSPMEVAVAKGSRPELELRSGLLHAARSLGPVTRPQRVELALVDDELKQALAALSRARARYARAERALEKQQERIAQRGESSSELRRLQRCEDEMEKAAGVAESAEAEVQRVKAERGVPTPSP